MESDAFHPLTMKIEEAIVYVLAERNGGLKTEQIAEIINRRKLHVRKDGLPVSAHRCLPQSCVTARSSPSPREG